MYSTNMSQGIRTVRELPRAQNTLVRSDVEMDTVVAVQIILALKAFAANDALVLGTTRKAFDPIYCAINGETVAGKFFPIFVYMKRRGGRSQATELQYNKITIRN